MTLIDFQYFTGGLDIPNISQIGVQERLTHFIEKYEPELLRDILGIRLYRSFMEAMEAASTDQLWVDLKKGTVYTGVDNQEYEWTGLVTEDRSLIANYVYFKWMGDQASQTSAVGEVMTKTENANRTSPIQKQVTAWNEMIEQIWQMWYFLDSNTATYTDWKRWYPTPYSRHINYRYINTLNL